MENRHMPLTIEEIKNKIKAEGETPELLCCLGEIYTNNKNFKKALKYIDKALELKKDFSYAHYIKGIILYNLHEKNALSSFLSAEKNGYKSTDMYYYIADLYQMDKEYQIGLKYANKAVKLDPENGNATYTKGAILYIIENYDKALTCLKKAEKLGCKYPNLYTKLSYLYYIKNNDAKKSIEYANKAIMANKKDNFAYYRKGWILYEIKDYVNAKKAFLKAETLGCKYADMYSRLSYIFFIEQNYNKSLEYANKAILLNDKDNFAYYRKGGALLYFENYEEAKNAFLKAEELGCKYDDMYACLSGIYYIKSDFKTSLKYINKAIIKNNKCPNYYFVKADNLSNLGMTKDAELYYQKGNLLNI